MVAFALNAVRDHHPLPRSRIIPTTTKPSSDVLERSFDTQESGSLIIVLVVARERSSRPYVFGQLVTQPRFPNCHEPKDFALELILDTTI